MVANLGLLLPDGVGIRNFVLGPFLSQASQCCTIHALHGIPESAIADYGREHNGKVQWHELLPFPDHAIDFVLRQSLNYAQMAWVDTFPMRLSRHRPVSGSWRTRAALRMAWLIGAAAASPRGIQSLDRLHAALVCTRPEVAHYRRLLARQQIDLLFCSHQRPTEIIPPVLAARSLGIPTATFIFSWDNLTSKGRIAVPFDHFLVWSPHMRDELVRYYPDVSPSRVHVVGTPQFDPYGDPNLLWSREEFCQRLGADPARPLICYSGGDRGNSPEDPQHVRVLLRLIREGRIEGRPQVFVRPSPVDDGERYASVRRDYPELIYSQPKWATQQVGNWAKVIPHADDIQWLANLTYHSDLNVNFGSTMTLDFAIRDKPVVNVAFDVSDPPVYGMKMWDYLQKFEHYRPVIELGAARFARSVDEFVEHANAYLQDPSLDRAGRRRFVELEVGVPVGQASRKVLEVLQQIAA